MRSVHEENTTVQPITLCRDPGKHTTSCLGHGAAVHPKQREIADVERHLQPWADSQSCSPG
eukprot:11095973-Alexandrium_andersonii.AAC.1